MPFEVNIIVALQSGATTSLTSFFEIVSLLGSWYGFVLAFLVFLFFSRRYAFYFAGTFAGGLLFNYILKIIFNRPRPYEAYSNIIGFSDALGQSMPSNHAFCVTVIAFFICYMLFTFFDKKWQKWLCGVVFCLLVVLVGISRMYLGVHYLSDIVAGICLGILISLLGLKLYNKSIKRLYGVLK